MYIFKKYVWKKFVNDVWKVFNMSDLMDKLYIYYNIKVVPI